MLDSTLIGVLVGGLVGFVSALVPSIVGHLRDKKESEDRLKSYASRQALELTKLEFDLRRETGAQNQFYAPAKVYREFYKALFELYTTKQWPEEIEKMGLLNVLEYPKPSTKKGKMGLS